MAEYIPPAGTQVCTSRPRRNDVTAATEHRPPRDEFPGGRRFVGAVLPHGRSPAGTRHSLATRGAFVPHFLSFAAHILITRAFVIITSWRRGAAGVGCGRCPRRIPRRLGRVTQRSGADLQQLCTPHGWFEGKANGIGFWGANDSELCRATTTGLGGGQRRRRTNGGGLCGGQASVAIASGDGRSPLAWGWAQ